MITADIIFSFFYNTHMLLKVLCRDFVSVKIVKTQQKDRVKVNGLDLYYIYDLSQSITDYRPFLL